jgi:hypothetical protein
MNPIEKFLHKISYKFPKGYPDMGNDQDKAIIFEEIRKMGINLEEVKLSANDLQKPFPPRNELAGKYEDRGERFLEKILNGEEFILSNGGNIILDKEKSKDAIEALKSKQYSIFSRGAKVLFDKDKNSYSLSDFEKTKEFGSGSGMGGGSKNTDIQESSQCVVNSIAYDIIGGKITSEDLTDDNIKKAYSLCDVTSTLEDCLDFIKSQPSWLETFIVTANILFTTYQNPNFQQHRGSKFVDKIYSSFKLAKNTQNLSFQSDKWNPSDIWMVDESILNMDFPVDISELNGVLSNLFIDKKLIGVSLKKTSSTPKIDIYNIEEKDVKGYLYEGYDSKETNNNTSIKYNDGIITFRTFNFATNFAGEIKGKTASHGKIGHGAINDIFKTNNTQTLPLAKDVQDKIKSQDPKFIEEFAQIYSKISSPTTTENMAKLIQEKDLNWLVSKYLSNLVAFIIDNQSVNIQNEIISDIIRYASSSTKFSSVFVKIS